MLLHLSIILNKGSFASAYCFIFMFCLLFNCSCIDYLFCCCFMLFALIFRLGCQRVLLVVFNSQWSNVFQFSLFSFCKTIKCVCVSSRASEFAMQLKCKAFVVLSFVYVLPSMLLPVVVRNAITESIGNHEQNRCSYQKLNAEATK